MKKIIRITTVPTSLKTLLKGQLGFMSAHYNVIGVSSSGKEMDDVEHDEGITTHIVEMTRSITPIKDLIATYKLYKFIKKENPFIVHTHTPKAGTLGMLAAKLAKVPHRLHTIAGLPLLETKGLKRKILNIVEKITYRNATLILPNSFGMLDIIKQHGFTKDSKLKVIGKGSSNGIDTGYFDPKNISTEQKAQLKKDLDVKSDDFVYVFVGRLVRDKGINELISAFKRINTQHSNTKLLLVGSYETELDPLADKTLKTINANPNIISVGWQNDVRPYFAISDALAFPSYREGFPNVVMQAGAMELSSIVTDINGCNEIITHSNNGLIIPVKNEEALYQSMNMLVSDRSLNKSLARSARSSIIKSYQRSYIWNELLTLYKSLEK